MWYLISTLNRYVIKNFLIWFFVIFLSTALIIGLFEMIELTRRTMQHEIGVSLLLQIALLKLPKFLNDFLPSVTFFAALGCFIRLSQSQNIVIILSCGISRMQFLSGLCTAVIAIGALNMVVMDQVRSVTAKRIVFLEEKIFQKKPYSIALTESGLWLRESQEKTQAIIHAESLNILEKELKNVIIFHFNNDGTIEKRFDVRSAKLENHHWIMNDVTITTEETQKKVKTHQEKTSITVEQIQHSTAPPETISFFEMSDFIEILKKSGLNATAYLMVWHKQISKIGMMIAFVILAASFSNTSTRSKSFSATICGSVIFAFLMHFVEHIAYAYGLAEKIPIIVAAWIPSIITISSGYWLMVMMDDR